MANILQNSVLIKSSLIIICYVTLSQAHLAPIAARLPLNGTPAEPGTPWPRPMSHTSESTVASFNSRNLQFTSNVNDCGILNRAFERYDSTLLFRDFEVKPDPSKPSISSVYVNISEDTASNLCNKFPELNLDEDKNYERYKLVIKSNGEQQASATIEAFTVWGALRGIETFSQLIWQGSDEEMFYINFTDISDAPRFPHRGFMVDSARHYVDLPVIEQILDAMSYNKLNVLHWHIVDDQSFPFVSTKFPLLSEKGAYLPELTYEPEEIQALMNYARDRGIRVILEFDTPGHTRGFGKAYPDLLTPCYGEGPNSPGTPNYPYHADFEILDPTSNFTYEFMTDFFTEIKNISQDVYVHLGMDEVYYSCWNSSPVIEEFMNTWGYENFSEVQGHYTVRHLEMVKRLGFKPIIWHDPIEFGVEPDKDVLIQVWKGGDPGLSPDTWIPYFQRVLDAGYQTILSSCWYLNYIEYGEVWKKYYNCDPITSLPEITDEQRKLILGGEAAVFGEYADSTNLVQRIFPYIGAVAERLWSPEFPVEMGGDRPLTDDAMHRLDQHRCRMLWRGIPAQPIFNGYCFSFEKSNRKNLTVPQPAQPDNNASKNIQSSVFLTVVMALSLGLILHTLPHYFFFF